MNNGTAFPLSGDGGGFLLLQERMILGSPTTELPDAPYQLIKII